MLPVKWTDEAIDDLAQIIAYLEDRNLQAAQRIGRCIHQAIDRLSVWPMMCREGREPGTREYYVDASYLLVYRVSEQVEIIRVLHTSRQYP